VSQSDEQSTPETDWYHLALLTSSLEPTAAAHAAEILMPKVKVNFEIYIADLKASTCSWA
jgi:hypothetical protein